MVQSLECVTGHRVYIYDRGGRRRQWQLVKLTKVEWSRSRDTISQAEVTIAGEACREQSDVLRQVEPKRMEMVIFRGNERVWEGPIMRVKWTSTEVTIVADDVARYIAARPLTREWNNSYTTRWVNGEEVERVDRTATTPERMEQILEYELTHEYERASTYADEARYRQFRGGSNPAALTRLYRTVIYFTAVDPVGSQFTWHWRLVTQRTDETATWSTTTTPTVGLTINGSPISIPAGQYLNFSGGQYQNLVREGTFTAGREVEFALDVLDRSGQLGRSQNEGKIIASDVSDPIPGWEQIDPPANVLPYLTVHHRDDDVRTATKTDAFQMTVLEHLDNFARHGGIDYTVIGRALHIWDTHNSLGRIRTLTEADFLGDVIVTAYGAEHAEIAFVVTEITEDEESLQEEGESLIRYGSAGDSSSYYGPWARIFTVYDEDNSATPTQSELNGQAERNLSGRSPVPVEVRVPDNSSIRLSETLNINDLVPGVVAPLLATMNMRQISQLQKLNNLTVTETADGEDVKVTFVPASGELTGDEEE